MTDHLRDLVVFLNKLHIDVAYLIALHFKNDTPLVEKSIVGICNIVLQMAKVIYYVRILIHLSCSDAGCVRGEQ